MSGIFILCIGTQRKFVRETADNLNPDLHKKFALWIVEQELNLSTEDEWQLIIEEDRSIYVMHICILMAKLSIQWGAIALSAHRRRREETVKWQCKLVTQPSSVHTNTFRVIDKVKINNVFCNNSATYRADSPRSGIEVCF